MSDNQDQLSSQGQPTGYEEGRQAGQAGDKGQRDKAGKAREEEPTPPPPTTCRHPTAAHQAAAGRQQGPPWSQTGPPERGCNPRLRNSTPSKGAHATRRPSRAHTQQRTPARTTAQNTIPPRQTPTPDDERAAKSKSKPRSPHSATAAVRMDVCAPGRVPNPCRLRNSHRPDGRVCARQ